MVKRYSLSTLSGSLTYLEFDVEQQQARGQRKLTYVSQSTGTVRYQRTWKMTWNRCRPVEQQIGGTAEVDIRVIV